VTSQTNTDPGADIGSRESRKGPAAVVRSSTIGPLNNRTNKRNKERRAKTIELLHIEVQWKYKLLRGATLLLAPLYICPGFPRMNVMASTNETEISHQVEWEGRGRLGTRLVIAISFWEPAYNVNKTMQILLSEACRTQGRWLSSSTGNPIWRSQSN